eukprot:SAG22_NODE_1388_length_4521_cov_13.635233_3_plen_706_part_00
MSLAAGTEPLGLLTVPQEQTLVLQTDDAATPAIVDARFEVHASLAATGITFRHESSSDQPLFSGDGALDIQSCQTVDSSGSTAPLQVACSALSLEHGHTGGQCGGALGDACGFLGCDQGYKLSESGVTRRCQAGGIWDGPPPTCEPDSCARASLTHSDRTASNMCEGVTGDRCEYSCDEGYQPHGEHVCVPGGQFSGGSCRPADLCLDDPAWRDTDGNGCAAHGASSCSADAIGLDTRLAADACPVSCGTCSCADDVDQDPGPGGVSCATVESSGLCGADAAVTGALQLAGAPLWTFCCGSCRGCDHVVNSGAVEDACGVCGGDGSSCAGCDGEANSGAVADACGVCGGDGSSCHPWPEVCTPTGGGMATVGSWAQAGLSTPLSVCLADDAAAAVGVACETAGCSPTVAVSTGELALDCSKGGADEAGLCTVHDRLDISGDAAVYLHRLRFAGGLDSGGDQSHGSAIYLHGDVAVFGVTGCAFGAGAGEEPPIVAAAFASLSLARLTLPTLAALGATMGGLSLAGSGSRLELEGVTIVERPERPLTGMLADGIVSDGTMSELLFGDTATFTVLSGPCTLAEGGRCVGRWPGGYGPNEECTIAVAAGGGGGAAGGVLGGCSVFNIFPGTMWDYLALPDGSLHYPARTDGSRHGYTVGGAVCPAGAVLAAGQSLAWHSDHNGQGDRGGNGLPYSTTGLGGGWQICFA